MRLQSQSHRFHAHPEEWQSRTQIKDAYAAAKADPFCFDICDKAVRG